ncbi:MAG: carbonic anhydrase [Acidobacteria bacterium]|nr:carbonic anhydrase [Acidobacteriota bacterium]
MSINDVLERNRAFARGRAASPLPASEKLPLAVVSCYDPRLDELLRGALGLAQGEAFLLRTAGALVQPSGGVIRSLAMAVFMFGVREVLVVGHSSCRMARFDTAEFVQTFRARGVPREAFGADDLREWAGAIASPRAGVARSVETIRTAAFFPRDLVVAGAVLDDSTGALEVVVQPGQPVPDEAPPAEPEHSVPIPAHGAPAQAEEAPAPPGAAPGARPPAEFERLAASMRRLLHVLESNAHWRDDVRRMRAELAQQRNPLVRYRIVEEFAREAAGSSREVAHELEGMRRDFEAARRLVSPGAGSRVLDWLTGGSK